MQPWVDWARGLVRLAPRLVPECHWVFSLRVRCTLVPSYLGRRLPADKAAGVQVAEPPHQDRE
eukprot:11914190-Alexandrium_andersonii.AAC.1